MAEKEVAKKKKKERKEDGSAKSVSMRAVKSCWNGLGIEPRGMIGFVGYWQEMLTAQEWKL